MMNEKSRQPNDALFFTKIKSVLNDGKERSVKFTIRGISMRPFLEHERDEVVLTAPRPPKVGQVVLAEVKENVYMLHRIIKIDGETITMRGDGNFLSSKEVFTADKIIGTASAFIVKGRYVSTSSFRWRFYSTMWNILKPFRRIILAIRKRII